MAVVLIGVAVVLRPRFGRVDPLLEVLSRDRAPELFALIDEVASRRRARPHIVAVDASSTRTRRRSGCGGGGCSASACRCGGTGSAGAGRPARSRTGHFVNGDVRRGLLTQPAFTMLGSAAELVAPSRGLDRSIGIASMLGTRSAGVPVGAVPTAVRRASGADVGRPAGHPARRVPGRRAGGPGRRVGRGGRPARRVPGR